MSIHTKDLLCRKEVKHGNETLNVRENTPVFFGLGNYSKYITRGLDLD